MILEIIVYCVIVICFGICAYVMFNLYNKVDNLEQWIDSTYIRVQDVLQEMRKIDSTGHFEADDEVGSTFNMLQDTIKSLDQIVEDHNA